MIKKRQPYQPPLVNWPGMEGKSYELFRLEELCKNKRKPRDGHDPKSPHRIGFHAMMLTTNGSFSHWLDFHEQRLLKNQLIYIAPNQIHHFMDAKKPFEAWLLLFRPEILPADLFGTHANDRVSWAMMSYLWPSITTLRPEETRLLDQQLTQLSRLDMAYPESYVSAARHSVCSTIALAFEFAKSRKEALSWDSHERFLVFVRLVEDWFTSRRDVKWYAQKMNCAERTLNRACKQAIGNSAKEFLTDRVVIEAKRLLTYGGDSVTLIANALGFAEATNFSRFFKVETGKTPQEFRGQR